MEFLAYCLGLVTGWALCKKFGAKWYPDVMVCKHCKIGAVQLEFERGSLSDYSWYECANPECLGTEMEILTGERGLDE